MVHNTPINVALAAYGMSGRVFHAPLITSHDGFKLRKVLERSGTRYSAEKYSFVEVVKEFNHILDDKSIELVVINTPEHTHYDLARQALLTEKHVIIEKAFTTTSAEAQALIELAGQKGRMLSVFQNSRWHSDFLTIRKIIEHNFLGRLIEFEAHYDRYRNFIQPGTWKEEAKPGTGVLYNLGSHMIDQVLVLFGWPQSLFADVRIQRPGGKVDDNFELIFYYADGFKVTLKSSYLVREAGPRYIIHGTAGSFVKYGADPQEALLKAGKSPLEENWGLEPEEQWGKLNTQFGGLHFEGKIESSRGSYLGFYENIYNVIRNNDELTVKPEQALNTIAIIEAAMKSSKEKQIVLLDSRRVQ